MDKDNTTMRLERAITSEEALIEMIKELEDGEFAEFAYLMEKFIFEERVRRFGKGETIKPNMSNNY